MSGFSGIRIFDANGIRVYDSKDMVIVIGKRDPEEKDGISTKADPEKDKFISQVINELGFGEESSSASMWAAQLLYNMAEKIAELGYEIKQIKEKANVL